MSKETLYRKVFVNGDEKNLPKEEGSYLAHHSVIDAVGYYHYDREAGDSAYWIRYVDWYLIEQPDIDLTSELLRAGDQPQEAKQPQQNRKITANMMILKHLFKDNHPIKWYAPVLDSKIEAMMEEYADERCDHIRKLFMRPAEKLKPLQELYRKEHPDPDGEYYIPDATKFYTWIAEKFQKMYSRPVIISQANGRKQCNCAKLNQCYVQDGKTICATCGGEFNMSNPTA